MAKQRAIPTYTRRRLTVLSYRNGIKGNNLLWRGVWYGLLLMRAVKWLRPQERIVAQEVLKAGESVTIRATEERVRPKRKK